MSPLKSFSTQNNIFGKTIWITRMGNLLKETLRTAYVLSTYLYMQGAFIRSNLGFTVVSKDMSEMSERHMAFKTSWCRQLRQIQGSDDEYVYLSQSRSSVWGMHTWCICFWRVLINSHLIEKQSYLNCYSLSIAYSLRYSLSSAIGTNSFLVLYQISRILFWTIFYCEPSAVQYLWSFSTTAGHWPASTFQASSSGLCCASSLPNLQTGWGARRHLGGSKTPRHDRSPWYARLTWQTWCSKWEGQKLNKRFFYVVNLHQLQKQCNKQRSHGKSPEYVFMDSDKLAPERLLYWKTIVLIWGYKSHSSYQFLPVYSRIFP